MKIKILKCSNSILWYSKHIGEEFEVSYIEDKAYWTRERDGVFNCLNWVYKEDCEVLDATYD